MFWRGLVGLCQMVGSEQGKLGAGGNRGVGRKGYKQDKFIANQCWT